MPSTLLTPIDVPNSSIPQFNGLEVTGVYVISHVQKAGEDSFSGNLEVGDSVSNPRETQKKLAIHFMLLMDDVVVYKDIVELDEVGLATLLADFVGLDEGVKAAAFKALLDANIIPVDAVIV